MKLPAAIKEAVETENAILTGNINHVLWTDYKLNYMQIYNLFYKYTGIDLPDFDELLQEYDYQIGLRG